MAEQGAEAGALRRSSRARKTVQRFEDSAYAADILHTQLRNADTFEDFMATLFLCFKPACYRPDLWRKSTRSEHRSIYMLASRHAKAVRIDPDVLMELAHAFATNSLDETALMNVINASTWEREGVRDFLRTIDVRPAGEEATEETEETEDAEGDDPDNDYEEGEEDDEDEDEDEDAEEEDAAEEEETEEMKQSGR